MTDSHALNAAGLLARLAELGIATPQQIEQAVKELAKTQERMGAILVRLGVLRDPDAIKRLAPQLGLLPQRPDAAFATAQPLIQSVAPSVWPAHHLVPLRLLDGTLFLATDDPLEVFAADSLAQWCGAPVSLLLVREEELAAQRAAFEAMRETAAPPGTAQPESPARAPAVPLHPERAAGPQPPTPPLTSEKPMPTPRAGPAVPAMPAPLVSVGESGEEPIIRLVDSILTEAVRMRASDVHLEPATERLRVRYRVDGVLRDINSPSRALHGSIVSRIKIMSGLNIAEKRLPQDGRLQLVVEHRPLDVRVSTLPSTHGESVVLRLLDRGQPIRGLQDLGMRGDDQEIWQQLIQRPHGMVLVTGPTGSGKTTTLYAALSMLNQPDRKLITVEDPVEYQLSGVNQVLVRTGVGLTFAAGLRAMLRQAPDVIMVGEIRDAETAQIAVQAALTGHLVLSTLHTNDAPAAITRLIDMGIAPFLVASTVQGVLAQRLVRRICSACRLTDHATPEERRFLGEPEVAQVIHSTGCDQCHGSGFLGRLGLFELLTVSEPIRPLLVEKATASAIRAAAVREGLRDLRADGIAKIREGLTTMAEVVRVVLDTEEAAR